MSTCRCHACGRPLTDPVSVEAGVGPSCAAQAATRPVSEIMFRSAYFAEEIDGVLVVFDRDAGSISVTNDVERVLAAELAQRGSLPRFVIYRDSTGQYDRIRHRNGVFGGFAPLGARSLTQALAALKEAQSA